MKISTPVPRRTLEAARRAQGDAVPFMFEDENSDWEGGDRLRNYVLIKWIRHSHKLVHVDRTDGTMMGQGR